MGCEVMDGWVNISTAWSNLYCLVNFLFIMDRKVLESPVFGPCFGRSAVSGRNEAPAAVCHFQPWKGMENFSACIVEQQDAYVAAVVGIPEGVHVIKEAQVANENEVELVGCRSIAEGSRQRTFYTVGSPVG